MKNFHLILAFLATLAVTSNALAAAVTNGKAGVPQPADVQHILDRGGSPSLTVLGTQVTQKKVNVMKAVYDYSKLGGTSGSTYKLLDAAGGHAIIPAGAIIIDGYIDEVTNVTGTSTISLGIETAVDLRAATAAATWSGVLATIPVATAASAVKVTSTNAAVTATLGAGSITAGKLNVFLLYLLSE